MKLRIMRSFTKINLSRNGEITLSFTGIGKSCLCVKFLTTQICLLTLFAKIKFCENIRIYSTIFILTLTVFFLFFCAVLSAKDIIPLDANGLGDPYVVVSFCPSY